mgnify:CR=1 FL=1
MESCTYWGRCGKKRIYELKLGRTPSSRNGWITQNFYRTQTKQLLVNETYRLANCGWKKVPCKSVQTICILKHNCDCRLFVSETFSYTKNEDKIAYFCLFSWTLRTAISCFAIENNEIPSKSVFFLLLLCGMLNPRQLSMVTIIVSLMSCLLIWDRGIVESYCSSGNNFYCCRCQRLNKHKIDHHLHQYSRKWNTKTNISSNVKKCYWKSTQWFYCALNKSRMGVFWPDIKDDKHNLPNHAYDTVYPKAVMNHSMNSRNVLK